jgi:hypothetical protein
MSVRTCHCPLKDNMVGSTSDIHVYTGRTKIIFRPHTKLRFSILKRTNWNIILKQSPFKDSGDFFCIINIGSQFSHFLFNWLYNHWWALASWTTVLQAFLSANPIGPSNRGYYLCFITIYVLRWEVVSLTPNPQPGGPGYFFLSGPYPY